MVRGVALYPAVALFRCFCGVTQVVGYWKDIDMFPTLLLRITILGQLVLRQ